MSRRTPLHDGSVPGFGFLTPATKNPSFPAGERGFEASPPVFP